MPLLCEPIPTDDPVPAPALFMPPEFEEDPAEPTADDPPPTPAEAPDPPPDAADPPAPAPPPPAANEAETGVAAKASARANAHVLFNIGYPFLVPRACATTVP